MPDDAIARADDARDFAGDRVRRDYERAPAGAFYGQSRNDFHAAQAEELCHGPEDRGLGKLDRVERWIGKYPASPAMLEEIDLANSPAVVEDPVFFGQGIDLYQTIRMTFTGARAGKGVSHLGHIEWTDLAKKFIVLSDMSFEQKRIEKEPDLFVQGRIGICQLQGRAVERKAVFYRQWQNGL